MDNLDIYRRMTSLPGGFQALDPPLSANERYSYRERVDARRPSFWRNFLPPREANDPRSYSFQRFYPGSSVVPNDAAVDRWLDAAQPMALLLQGTETRNLVVSGERDSWKKLTQQKGTLVSWFVESVSPPPNDLTIPDGWHASAVHLLEVLRRGFDVARRLGRVPVDQSDPSDTNSGFPLFTAHPVAKLASLCFYSGSWEGTLERAEAWCRAQGIPEAFALANGFGQRSGPSYKWIREWRLQLGDWRAEREMRGYSQRNRVVQMSPAVVNRLCRPWYLGLHYGRSVTLGHWRTGDEDSNQLAGYPFRYEGDISGYDTSVTLQLQAALVRACAEAWPELANHAHMWLLAEQRGLIGPHWGLNPLLCTLYSAVAGTSSGLKPTADIGTVICSTTLAFALGRQGVDIRRYPKLDGIAVVVQGDDVAIGSDFPLDAEAFNAAFQEVGLSCELKEGYTFLSKHILESGVRVPIAGRLVQQTMSNEHEPIGRQAPGLLLLGFVSRFQNWHLVEPELRDAVTSVIMHAQWIAELRLPSVDALLSFADSSDGRRLIEVALQSRLGKSWLLRQSREGGHSEAARVAMALAQRHKIDLDTLHSEDRLVELLGTRVMQAPRLQQDRLLHTLTRAAVDGTSALDAVYATTLKEFL